MTQAVELQKLVKKAFDKYDVDGSGALDYDELNLKINDMCFHLDLPELGMCEMSKILDSVDESGDGEVQFEEFLEHVETVITQMTTFVANLNIPGSEDTESEYNPVDNP
jgi:Ca2+-binding EF-hand superfamily protein